MKETIISSQDIPACWCHLDLVCCEKEEGRGEMLGVYVLQNAEGTAYSWSEY